MLKKVCIKCKKDFSDVKINTREADCPNCKSKKSLFFEKIGTCQYCGKKFVYHTKCTSNEKKFDSEECRQKFFDENSSKFNKKIFYNTMKSDKIEKIISEKLLNTIIQEVLVNGEDTLLEIINVGKKEMFGIYKSSYKDDSSYYNNYYKK